MTQCFAGLQGTTMSYVYDCNAALIRMCRSPMQGNQWPVLLTMFAINPDPS